MSAFAWNLILALVWSALMGELSSFNFAVGFLLGYAILRWLDRPAGIARYVRRLPRAAVFAVFYVWEVVSGALRVAHEVVTPGSKRRPGIVAVPLESDDANEIVLFANLLTFAPGTLSIDVTEDRRYLLVHGMFVRDPEAFKTRLKRTIERRVLESL